MRAPFPATASRATYTPAYDDSRYRNEAMRPHWHPWQRVGSCAIAALTGLAHPTHIREHHLDTVADIIVTDAQHAARAARRGPGYAWWLALAAAFPNSPPVHPARARWTDPDLTARLRNLFSHDTEDSYTCCTCGAPTDHRWGKSRFPLAASDLEINYAAPDADGRRRPGLPVCRPCRISVWAMLYGSLHNGHTITTYDLAEEAVLMEITRQIVTHNRTLIDQHATTWGRPWPDAPRADDGIECQVLTWRNDNRNATLRLDQWEAPTPLAAHTHTPTHTNRSPR